MEKYYTPEIEEFHVGFEYEALWSEGYAGNESGWNKCTVRPTTDLEHIYDVLSNEILQNDIDALRVKYLDEEDILACGWNFVSYGLYKWGIAYTLTYSEGVYRIFKKRQKIFKGTINLGGEEFDILITDQDCNDFVTIQLAKGYGLFIPEAGVFGGTCKGQGTLLNWILDCGALSCATIK